MAKISFLDRLFPPKYNFHRQLQEQVDLTARGIRALAAWLEECRLLPEGSWLISENSAAENRRLVINCANQADIVRLKMESELVEAFATPMQRQDIYFLSVQMDKMIESARTTVAVSEALVVQPDQAISDMAGELARGAEKFAEAVRFLELNPIAARNLIAEMRRCHIAVERRFLQELSVLYRTAEPVSAMRYREVYVQLRNGARAMETTVDSLHRAVVRLV